MGVTYKLKEEVVQFIISLRQSNPLLSCRELAEGVANRYQVHVSKSSVHDVLREADIVTPRGRKPKDKFQIPQQKKEQIQASLNKIALLGPIPKISQPDEIKGVKIPPPETELNLIPDPLAQTISRRPKETETFKGDKSNQARSPLMLEHCAVYERAGEIFLKAALWDLGLSTAKGLSEMDWHYYLTYAAGIKVVLENGSHYLIRAQLPLQRCVMEVVDGLINNTAPLIVHQGSGEELFKDSMNRAQGKKIRKISIVDDKDHDIANFDILVDHKCKYIIKNRIFMVCDKKDPLERATVLFFPQLSDNKLVIEEILALKGFDSQGDAQKYSVTLLIEEGHSHKNVLQEAVDRVNAAFVRDHKGRLLEVKL